MLDIGSTITLPAGSVRLALEYTTNFNATFTAVPGGLFTSASCVNVAPATGGGCTSTIALAASEYITAIRWRYLDSLPFGFVSAAHSFQATVESSPVNAIIVNRATSSYTYNGIGATRTGEARTRVVEPGARPTVTKSVSPAIVYSGQMVTYTLTLDNTAIGSPAAALDSPILADLLTNSLSYVDGSSAVLSKPLGAPDPTIEILPNYNASGRTLLRWAWRGYSLPAGETITLSFQAQINPATPSGAITNTAALASFANPPGEIFITSCSGQSSDGNDLDGDGNTSELICSSSISSVSLAEAANTSSLKLVMGQLDSAWTRDPQTGLTTPGGMADYQLVITNTNTVALTSLVLIDILPWEGDSGVVRFQDPRGSQWRPYLIGPIAAPAGATVYYSTATNPCRNPELGLEPDSPGCAAPAWSTVSPADITTVGSVKIDFGGLILQPQDSVRVTWPMRAPVGGSPGEIAWNTFGYRARDLNGTYLLAAEPPRVGIERGPVLPPAYGNYVWHDGDLDGTQDPGELGVNGARIDLYRDSDGISGLSAGDTFVAFTVSGPDDNGNPGYYLFSDPANIPPDSYYTFVTPPAGYDLTAADAGADDTLDSDVDQLSHFTPVTSLASGEEDTSWDVGLVTDTAVGNYIWIDRNANGIQDDPPSDGVNGITIRLYNPGPDGQPGGGDDVLLETTATADDHFGMPGYYMFAGLTPGSFFVEFALPSGFSFTSANSGSDTLDSDADLSGRTGAFSLVANQLDTTRDAGLILAAGTLTLGDRIWRDTDNDGRYEPLAGEVGVDGVQVNLFRDLNANGLPDDGEYVGGTTTRTVFGIPGAYQFSSLVAGTYIVVVDAQSFSPGGALYGLRSSSGNDPAPDPDDNADNDDNGSLISGLVRSLPIALSIGGEPTSDGDGSSGNQTLDFGFIGGAALGDRVWFDVNGDGVQSAGEPGVADITVELLDGSGNPIDSDPLTIGTQPTTTITDSSGRYGFTSLAAGSYRLRFSGLPPGYSFTTTGAGTSTTDSDAAPLTGTTSSITLAEGQADLSWDAGLISTLASLGDLVWDDLNRNGIQDIGEDGLAGVTASLYRPGPDGAANTGDDELVISAITDASGIYGFSDLAPGSYFVRFSTLPAGYAVSPTDRGADDTRDSDADVGTRRTGIISLSPGEHDPGWDMGLFTFASIGDRVWSDTNNDGIQDAGEPGVSGVAVRLYQTGSGVPIATTSTTGGGLYSFTNLIPDSGYYLEFSLPGGYRASPQDQGADDTADSDASQATYQTAATTLDPGENDTSWDFGIFPTASIGDQAWLDYNADGIRDSGETAVVPGVQVVLYDTLDNQLDTTVTDATGFYRFSGLIPGTYYLRFILPPSYLLSPQDQGASDTADSDVSPATFRTAATGLIAGENDLSWDIGLYQPSSLGDHVWHDVDGDGLQDGGELGVANVPVSLYQPGLDGLAGTADDSFVASTTTDADGTYSFSGLAPASYFVQFGAAPGFSLMSPRDSTDATDATDSDTDANRRTQIITLASSTTDITLDMGVLNPASLGNYVWFDANVDGVQGAGESGVAGVTVALFTAAGVAVDGDPGTPGVQPLTDTTDASGGYLFSDLVPGEYYLVFSSLPADRALTRQNQGADDALDSDINPLSGATGLIRLLSGANDLSLDAGIYETIRLGDRVWIDSDANGAQDAGETLGVPGVRIELLRNSDNALLDYTYTDGDGMYLFSDIFPDTYRLHFSEIPAGFVRSPQDRGPDDALDSDAGPGFETAPITTTSGSDLRYDLGLYQLAAIGDTVWEDRNGNGVQNAGEPGIAGVLVSLSGTDGVGNAISLSTTTAADGSYGFGSLVPGSYTVTVARPAGYTFSAQNQGADDSVDSDTNAGGIMATTDLSSGEMDMAWDAGLYQPVRLGNLVWGDLNNNGLKDAGESGIDGVSVNLAGTDGAGNSVSLATTTASGGLYLFDNLTPGTYTVELPASNFSGAGALAASGAMPAYRSSTGTNGGATGPYEGAALADPDGNIDGDDSGNTDGGGNVRSLAVTLRSQDEPLVGADSDDNNGNLTLDFGVFRPLSLGNLVWNDLNTNKVYDSASESGINGVSVQLYRDTDGNNAYTAGTDTLVTTTSTAGGGLYLFDNLSPGNYVVVIPAANFGAGAALNLFRSSDGGLATDSATDPDAGNINGDDNGIGPSGGVVSGLVSSGAVTLSVDGEPTDDGDASSNSNLSLDFGFYSLGVGNLVFEDRNNNGLLDGTDAGLNGRTVSLYYDADSSGTLTGAETTAVATIATSNGGHYFFGGLRSGASYQIGATTPGAGWVSSAGGANGAPSGPYEPGRPVNGDSSDSDDNGTQAAGNTVRSAFFTVSAGAEPTTETDSALPSGLTNPAANNSANLTIDFGLFNQARLGDFVWIDTNGNGVQEGGEIGLGGVTVKLYDTTNALIRTTTTSAAGLYGFSYLLPGSYYVEFSGLPAGYAISPINAGGTAATNSDADQTSGQTTSFTLVANANDTSWDMGLYPRLSLGNLVWDDLNDNGLFDSATESGIDGVIVELYRDTNGSGSYEAGTDALVTSQMTVAGSYLFTGLTQGDYLVVVPASNFASGQPLYLYRSSTGANGAASGPYEPALDPDNNLNSDDNGTGAGGLAVTRAISLNPNVEPTTDGDADVNSNLSLDLGFFQALSLGNLVWDDLNDNGLFDSASESGIGGVRVELYADTNGSGSYEGGADTPVASTTTDGGGLYGFSDLIPGSYLVVLPAGQFAAGQPIAGYVSSTGTNGAASGPYEPAPDPDDPAGAPTANDADNDDNGSRLGSGDIAARAVTLARATEPDAGVDADGTNANQAIDFGLFRPASLGDKVWHDVNANGVQDAGEPGIDGVTVSLYDAADTLVGSATTAGGGVYTFSNLVIGDYYVVFGATATYSQVSPPNAAAATATTNSDADRTTRRTATTSLVAGENDPSWDVGLYNLASLGDRVWEDTNGNGVQEAGEPGVDGVIVNLYDGGNTLITTTTTVGSGAYSFSGLTPGSYYVVITPPAGYQITLQDNASGATADQLDSDADRTIGRTILTTLVSGQNDPTWDAGLFKPASLGDTVWEDLNGDGTQDAGEPGVAGRSVILRWAGPDGALDTGDDTTAIDITDSGGLYGFANLIPGTYRVEFGANPAGYTYTVQGAGGPTNSDASPANGRTSAIALASGQDDTSWDAGIYQLLSLGNLVWADLNNNGAFDSAIENGIGGVVVELYADSDGSGNYSSGDTLVTSATTAGSGLYGFNNLLPGDYVVVIPASNFAAGGPLNALVSSTGASGSASGPYEPASDPDDDQDNHDDGGQSGGDVASMAITLSLYGEPGAPVDGDAASGNQTMDFGFFQAARLGDLVWEDRNGDGVQDVGEPGVDGVTVTLYQRKRESPAPWGGW